MRRPWRVVAAVALVALGVVLWHHFQQVSDDWMVGSCLFDPPNGKCVEYHPLPWFWASVACWAAALVLFAWAAAGLVAPRHSPRVGA